MENYSEAERWMKDAKDSLARARRCFKVRDWRGTIQNSQLAIELSVKGVIALFEDSWNYRRVLRCYKMRFTIRIIVWLAILPSICFLNCSRDYPLFEKPNGRFPLRVGNEWWLRREWKIEFHNGHPLGFEDPWVERYSIHWEIVDRDILEGYKSWVLKNEWYKYGEGGDSSFYWYTDSWEGTPGLYNIGYTRGGGPQPPKLPRGYRLNFAGEEFSSWDELSDWLSSGQLVKKDTVVKIPPEVILEYPLEVGKEWIAIEGLFGPVKRRVVGRETVITKAGNFYCYKVEVTLDYEPWQYSMIQYDWFSDEGLVKRYIWFTGEWTDPWGNPAGTFEITDVYLLDNYSTKK